MYGKMQDFMAPVFVLLLLSFSLVSVVVLGKVDVLILNMTSIF